MRDAGADALIIACRGPVVFDDPAFEGVVAQALGVPIGAVRGEDAARLTSLNLSGQGVQSIQKIECFAQLQFLDITGNKITDLSPLAHLAALETLLAGENAITIVPPLPDLKRLRILYLHSNPLADISHLSDLVSLEALFLGSFDLKTEVSFKDISVIASLEHLTDLMIVQAHISDISPLRSLSRIDKLNLRGNAILDLTPLASSPVHQLVLDDNPVTDLSPRRIDDTSRRPRPGAHVRHRSLASRRPYPDGEPRPRLHEGDDLSALSTMTKLTNLVFDHSPCRTSPR